MDVWKQTIRRIVMSCLVILALFTTFQSISGVQAKDFSIWLFNQSTSINKKEQVFEHKNHSERKVALGVKSLSRVAANQKVISSEAVAMPKRLEDAFDWDQYPSRKVVATGYTAGIESTGKSEDHPGYGITYSGVKVKRDLYSTIAADLSVFPIGTILFIPGYGYGVVADKGGAIKGHKLDLYYETVDDVYDHWGKKEVEVYVVQKGDGSLTEEELKTLNEEESMQVFRRQIIKS